MKLKNINIEEMIASTKKQLDEDPGISPGLKSSIELLLTIVTLLVNRQGLNSSNSSISPSSDPNRTKKKKPPGPRKPGGQKGHNGSTLEKVSDPDVVKNIPLDKKTLPKGNYKEIKYESRQVIDIDISRFVTEYRAQILEDDNGGRHTALFPEGVRRPVQYGVSIKVNSVYNSQYQLIPYDRVAENFRDQAGIPISGGSIYNFNKEAYDKLETFENIVKTKLAGSYLCHADETGVNIGGDRHWLHCLSNESFTCFLAHKKRGFEAIEAMGVLPDYKGILCHDHWKPYFKLGCRHVLCNSHHLRELERAWEQDNQQWAQGVRELLLQINVAVEDAGGCLTAADSMEYRQKYRDLLQESQKECPPPDESQKKRKRGRLKRSKARNLLERLTDYENETLLFMDDEKVPFTNNQGERDIRMTKVQQKISGCFRSMKGAAIFCRVRGYLSTCKKNGVKPTEALRLLFEDNLPQFLNEQ